MKQSTTQRILEVAKKHPNGFTATDVRAVIKGKPERIYVALSTLKKKGVLEHDSEMGRYKLKSVRVSVPMASWDGKPVGGKPITKEKLQAIIDTLNVEQEAEPAKFDDYTSEILEWKKKYLSLNEQYTDALAIIRYLESKLVTAIQHDARSQG